MAPAHREHNCIHEHLGEPVEPRRRTRQLYEAGEGGPPPEKSGPDEGDGDASGMQPLRIVINTDALRSDPGYTCFRVGEFVNGQPCRQEQVLTPVKRSTLEESLMPRAAAFFSKALSVKRVVGNLRLGSFRCGFSGGVAVPREYATTGVEGADIVFFVTARPIAAQTGSDTIAFSGHCEVDQFGRPIAAHFNWSPVHLDVPNSDFESTYLLRVALHEMTHALVFSPGLFDQFHRQPATAFLPAVGGGRTRAIVTPRALRVARNHFDCPELEGAPLEDGGGAGTGGAHWEMRLFRDEYMTGSASPGVRVISELTLAVFSDSGWYAVDGSLAEPFAWGARGGCAFALEGCDSEVASSVWHRPGYRCSQTHETGCSYDRRAEVYCDLRTYSSSLPPHQQHFPDRPDVGGYSVLLDYCPVFRPYANGNCAEAAAGWERTSEERCEACRCFSKEDSFGSSVASCYRARCLNATTLEVRANGRWRRCPTEGGPVLAHGGGHAPPPPPPPHPPGGVAEGGGGGGAGGGGLGGLAGWVGQSVESFGSWYGGEVLQCPPAVELCALDADIWPVLTEVWPARGTWRGGAAVRLRGENLHLLHPPLTLSFGLPDGTDVLASNLSLLNGTHALAVQPPFGWLTYYAVADVLLSDSLGRTAYIFAGYTIAPDPLQYAATAALVVLLVALSCALPAYLRAGCAAEMRRPRHAAKALRGAAATAAAGQGGASSQRSAGGGSSALV